MRVAERVSAYVCVCECVCEWVSECICECICECLCESACECVSVCVSARKCFPTKAAHTHTRTVLASPFGADGEVVCVRLSSRVLALSEGAEVACRGT